MRTSVTFATHFEAFLNFASKEPPERIIEHHIGGWCGCAIGDYHREATSEPPKGFGDLVTNDVGSYDSPLLDELEKAHGLIFESLNNGKVPENYEEEYEIGTYNGLALFMRDFAGVEYNAEFEEAMGWT